ncbi:MAG: energy transducer TonB [Pseudomonadota bacterium]
MGRRPAACAVALVLAGSAIAAPAAPGAPGSVKLPAAQFNQRVCDPPQYPHEARVRNWTGKVELRFEVSAAGVVTHTAVQRSSGHAVLDDAALASLRTCRFPPVVVDGVAVAATDLIEYVWALDDNLLGAHLAESGARHAEPSDIGKAQLFGISAVPARARDEVLRDLQYRATLDAGCANLEAARFEPASAAEAPKLAPPGKGMLQDVRDVHERWHVQQCGHEVRYLLTVRLHEDSLVRHHAVLEGSRRLPAMPGAAQGPASGPSGKGP